VKRVIVDTGPLVALLNANETHHASVRETLDAIEPPLWTCEAVITETCFLVRHLKGGADAVFNLVSRGVVRVEFRLSEEIELVRRLITKYASVPMSLADACLVRMTELHPTSAVLTLDADFRVYRRNGRHVVPLIPVGPT
jgi:uncharacterized protein